MAEIILVTSGQPALNPRLVKEADTLTAAGFEVLVIYAYWNDWGKQLTEQLLATKKWKAVCAGGSPGEKPFVYWISRLCYKIARWGFSGLHFYSFAEFAVARAALPLLQTVKKYKAEIYIGHNLGALPAVIIAAKKHKAKCGFDAEDFHRQEVSDDPASFNYKIATHLENKYYSQLTYFTTSSPQISKVYRSFYQQLSPVTVLNVFPNKLTRNKAVNKNSPLKLFWFSQTIGPGRGLRTVAKALKQLNPDDFELHLLGDIDPRCKPGFIEDELAAIPNIFFHGPIPSDDIIPFASQFDIGLATENTVPLNRDICLTNKLFTYLNAGLAVIASDTTAQDWFIKNNPEIGTTYPTKEIEMLAGILSAYQTDRDQLLDACNASLSLARTRLNWENEGIRFLSLIKQTLHTP